MYYNAEPLITTKSCLEVKFLNCYNTPTSFPLRLIITSKSILIFSHHLSKLGIFPISEIV